MPNEMRAGLRDPRFWAMYFFEREFYFGPDPDADLDDDDLDDEAFDLPDPEHDVLFGVGDGHGVELTVSDGRTELGVRVPGVEEAHSVGWDDQAHFQPHVFRWAELDLVCRAAALRDAELRHPGPVLALLGRFLVVTGYDDVEVITSMLHAAFTGLRPDGTDGFWPDAHGNVVRRADYRGQGVVWHRDEDGNLSVWKDLDAMRGEDLYSLRWAPAEAGPDAYPWAAWRATLAAAERTLARAVEPRWLANAYAPAVLDRAIADRDPAAATELAAALAKAGCTNATILSALTDPVHPTERSWVLELLSTAPRGRLVSARLDRGAAPTDARPWW